MFTRLLRGAACLRPPVCVCKPDVGEHNLAPTRAAPARQSPYFPLPEYRAREDEAQWSPRPHPLNMWTVSRISVIFTFVRSTLTSPPVNHAKPTLLPGVRPVASAPDTRSRTGRLACPGRGRRAPAPPHRPHAKEVAPNTGLYQVIEQPIEWDCPPDGGDHLRPVGQALVRTPPPAGSARWPRGSTSSSRPSASAAG